MRKHDVRKWLHAILDLLPVILIPVFMIYSHRHTIDSGSIEIPQREVVDFNQQVYNGKPTSLDCWSRANGTLTYSDGSISFVGNNDISDKSLQYVWSVSDGSKQLGHKYYFKFVYSSNTTFNIQTINQFNNIPLGTNIYYSNIAVLSSPSLVSSTDYFFNYNPETNPNWSFTLFSYELIDLTQMYGYGNEPTKDVFESQFPNGYYDFVLSKKVLADVGVITYNDTDIMSQFTYQLYNSVDKYFNVGNVFHLGEVYDWFNLNIFNGNAPIYIYVVYQIVLYELIMDLLFLLYALFMWFIDMIEKLMEKPLNSVR